MTISMRILTGSRLGTLFSLKIISTLVSLAQPVQLSVSQMAGAPTASRPAVPLGSTSTTASSPQFVLPPLTTEEIASRRATGRAPVGQHRDLPRSVRGTWLQAASGDWFWTASIRATGAAGIRLHFTNFDIGKGRVWIHDGAAEHGQLFGPYTEKGPMGAGDLWTEVNFKDIGLVDYLP